MSGSAVVAWVLGGLLAGYGVMEHAWGFLAVGCALMALSVVLA